MSKGNGDILKAKPNLQTIDVNELKSIKVALKRSNVSAGPQPENLHRSLDDPKLLRVNLFGVPGRRIFYRGDVLVNRHELTDEQFYGLKDESADTSEPQPGTSRDSQNSRLPFGGFINKPVPFDEPSKDDSQQRYKHSKSPRRSRSKSRSRSPYRRKSRRSRSSSEEMKYRERGYGKKLYNRKHSPPLRPGEYRPKKRLSASRSPDRRRHYRSRERSHSPDERHRRAVRRRSKSFSPPRSPTYKRKGYHRTSRSPDNYRKFPSSSNYSSKKYNSTKHRERSFSRDRDVIRLRPGIRSPNSHPLQPVQHGLNPQAYNAGLWVYPYSYDDFPPQIPLSVVVVRPPMRPPFPPMIRPPPPHSQIVYNHRQIPKFVSSKEGTSKSNNGDENSGDKKKKDESDGSK